MQTENQKLLQRDTIPKPGGLGLYVRGEERSVRCLSNVCPMFVQSLFNIRSIWAGPYL